MFSPGRFYCILPAKRVPLRVSYIYRFLSPMNPHQRSGETMRNRCLGAALLLLTSFAAAQNTITERLRVDATDAPRNILHSTVTIPVTSGSVTLVYPKWIPGNHRPTVPIQHLV